MFADQLEDGILVIEIMPKGIYAVMAAQAIIPISLAVGMHEIRLDLLMTVRTDRLVEIGKVICVAIIATERGTIGQLGVRGERITS